MQFLAAFFIFQITFCSSNWYEIWWVYSSDILWYVYQIWAQSEVYKSGNIYCILWLSKSARFGDCWHSEEYLTCHMCSKKYTTGAIWFLTSRAFQGRITRWNSCSGLRDMLIWMDTFRLELPRISWYFKNSELSTPLAKSSRFYAQLPDRELRIHWR